MKQGDIVIINFPFNSFSASKIRPALIVSNSNFNKGLNVILAAISTKDREHSLSLNKDDLFEGNLTLDFQIFLAVTRILCLEKLLVLKKNL